MCWIDTADLIVIVACEPKTIYELSEGCAADGEVGYR